MKKSKKNKLFFYCFFACLIVLISGTFAWYIYSLESTDVVFEIDGIYVNYDSGSNISNINLIPTATKEEGI